MVLNGGLVYIDGHLDLRPGKRWPHSITDDDLKAVIGAFLTATARVSPNLNPHAHCHDAMAPFSVTGERMNVAGSSFSGLSMRCTSIPPCLLARQKKARSSVPHSGRWHQIHCNRCPDACGLLVDDAGIGTRAWSCASCGTSNVLLVWVGKICSPGKCSVASCGCSPTRSFLRNGVGAIAPRRRCLQVRCVVQRRMLCSISAMLCAEWLHILHLHKVGFC